MKTNSSFQSNDQPAVSTTAFTLIELLVVIEIIAILTSLLLPTLDRAKAKAQTAVCAGNLKELQLGWKMYTDENGDVMPLSLLDNNSTRGLPGSWVLGNSRLDADLTNLQSGALFRYVPSVGAFHCPADRTHILKSDGTETRSPVNRSYCINHALNGHGGYSVEPYPWPYANPRKLSAIVAPGPAEAWVFIEKGHFSGGEPVFAFGILQDAVWADGPTDRHSMSCNLSFIDGHVAAIRWKAPKETRPYPEPGIFRMVATATIITGSSPDCLTCVKPPVRVRGRRPE